MRLASLVACLLCALHGEAIATRDTLYDLAVPGGIAAAVDMMGDARDVDPGWFAYDLVLRFYNQPADALRTHDPSLRRLLDWFATQRPTSSERPITAGTQHDTLAEGVPSPLSADAWRTVLGITDPSHPDPDLGHVLASHDVALLYVALLRMPPATRAALASDPAHLRALLPHASALAIVAPVLDRDADGWLLPGGDSARPVWVRLTGRASDDPRFLQALLTRDQGWVCVLADVVGLLSAEQQHAALGPGTPAARAAERLLRALRLASPDWQPRQRPFWRPTLDPALMLAQLSAERDGLQLPGSARAWSAMLSRGRLDPRALADRPRSPHTLRPRVSPDWLVEQAFRGTTAQRRLAYDQVLFAQRLLAGRTELSPDAAAVVHAVGTHPQLVLTLERLGVRQPDVYVRVVHLARALETSRAAPQAVVRMQAALMLLVHARAGGSLAAEDVEEAVTSLVEATEDGGPGVRTWLQTLTGHAGQSLDAAVVRFAAGPRARDAIDWEDTAYWLDPAMATVARIARLRGVPETSSRPVPVADAASLTGWLVELTYALAMGSGEELPLRPAEAAARHALGRGAGDLSLAWSAPVVVVDEGTRWHVRGSLLGLDAALAPLALRRASTRMPPRRPSLNTADRRVLVESAAMVRRAGLHATLAHDTRDAIERGRAHIAATLHDSDRCGALIDDLPLGHARRALLAWTCRHDPSRLPRALSVRDVIALAETQRPLTADTSLAFRGAADYGALAQPLSGAWSLWLPPLADSERLGGHWGTGVAASLFADLHVRVLGLLGELDLPATLLPEALAGVTWEFVTHAPAAYPDDWFALNEMVWRVDIEAVERALALHTGDGVLRPVDVP